MSVRRLVVVLGDQLDADAPLLQTLSSTDVVWMAEVRHEAEKVWSHQARIALFLAAMRHFAAALRRRGHHVDYQALDEHDATTLDDALRAAIARHRPAAVHMTEAGEYAVAQAIAAACAASGVPLQVEQDRHFLTSHAEFAAWSQGRRQWVMEHFYRHFRRRSGYLMAAGQPVGGQWNLDRQNRRSFGRQGPGLLPAPGPAAPDATTREVLRLVAQRFPDHPGGLSRFDWPVTRAQALAALQDFVAQRLAAFGPYQDAMWSGEPWLYHSRLAAALNLKLLNPREVLDAVVAAYDAGQVPLNSAEGFVRQVLGWREYVRHLYWSSMPGLLQQNALGAQQPLPAFYWTADTELRCLRETLGQTLEYGYAHHIQRLMVTGLFALLLGVQPRQLHQWYLAVYVDAVEWVEAPNTIGMSQFADGGRLASKPYAASGRYIQRMSDYCARCPYDPAAATGERACPFTVLYWDFLQRHATRFAGHPRTALQWRNLQRLDRNTLQTVARDAAAWRTRYA